MDFEVNVNAKVNGLDDVDKLEDKIDSLSKKAHDVNINMDVNGKEVQKEIDTALGKTQKQVKNNPVKVDYEISKGSVSRLTDTANRVFSLFTGTDALNFGSDKIRSAISNLKELNTTLVEIDKTGNITNSQLSNLANNSFDSASKWGALVQDYMSSTETFAQTGFSNLEEMSDLSTMAQVAGQMTAETSTKFLIASDAAWQMHGNVEKLTSVLDGMNMITNKNALQMTDLANGIRVAGSMLANSGLTEDQSAALLGTGIATTKEAGETVARGVRTIIMNLRQIKGETEDGELINDEQLKKVEATCESVGVSLKTVKNGVVELRNPIDILRELSEVYNSLDTMDARRAEITDNIGGKHRSNILSSILTNFNQYDKMLNDYANGEGSAYEEAMKSADSWQGRLNSLSNSWTEFVSGFADVDAIKGGISLLDGMISSFDKMNDLGVFVPSFMSGMMGLKNLFTGKGITDIGISQAGTGSLGKLDVKGNMFGIDFTKMGEWKRHFAEAEIELDKWNAQCLKGRTNIEDFGGEFVKQNKNFKEYIATTKDGSATLAGYKQHLSDAGVQFQKFSMKSVLANAATGFLVGTGIELAVAGITKLADYAINYNKNIIAAGEEAKANIQQQTEAYETQKNSLRELSKEYTSMADKVDIGDNTITNKGLSASDFERFLEVNNEIADIAPSMVKSYDSQGNAILNLGKNTSDINKQIEDYISLQRDLTHISVRDQLQDQYKGTLTETNLIKDEISDINMQIEENIKTRKRLENYKSALDENADGTNILSVNRADEMEVRSLLDDVNSTYDIIDAGGNELQFSITADKNTKDTLSKLADSQLINVDSQKSLLQSQLQEQRLLAQSKWKEMIPSLQSYVNSSNLFDEMASDDANLVKDGLSKMLSNIDLATNLDEIDAAGSIDNWIDKELIAPMLTKESDVSRAWKSLLKLENDRENMSVGDWAKQRNEYLDKISGGDKAYRNELAKRMGYAYEDADGLHWVIKDQIDNAAERTGIDRSEIGKYLNSLKPEDYEIMMDIIVNDEEAIAKMQSTEDMAEALADKKASIGVDISQSFTTVSASVKNLLTDIAALNTALDSQSTGKSISLDDFNSDALKDYQSALEYVNGAMQLNQERAEAITKAKAEEKLATIATNKALQQSQYSKNAREIQELISRYDSLSETELSHLSTLQEAQSQIVSNCQQYDIMSASIREATGAYQEWLNAQNAPESGDMYDDAQSAMEVLKDGLETGKTGTEKYEAAVEFLIPDDIPKSEVAGYMDKLNRYLKDSDQGTDNFLSDSVKEGLMTLEDGIYSVADGIKMSDFVDKLHITPEMAQAIFGELEEYDFEFDWSDENITSISDALYQATVDADAIQARIDEINAQPIKTSADYAELEMLNQKLQEANTYKEQLSGERINAFLDLNQQISDAQVALNNLYRKQDSGIAVDASEISAAEQLLASLLQQKEQLGAPTVIEIDAQISMAQHKIQELQAQKQAALSAPYSTGTDHIAQNAQSEIDSLNGKISSLQAVKLEVESSSVDEAQNKVDKLNGTDINNKNFSVTAEAGQAIANLATVKSYLGSIQSKTVTVTVATNHVTTGSRLSTAEQAGAHGGYVGVNGTAHVKGTAFANGNWGNPKTQEVLIGELGREIVVDPNSGRWRSYGDNGAEFATIPRNAIVFNHLQTEALLERGFVAGRGTAFASGTAMVTGGGSKGINSGSKYKGYNKSSSSASSTEKAISSAQKAAKDTINNLKDWIEELNDKIDLKQLKSDNAITVKNKNKYIDQGLNDITNAIKKITKEYSKWSKVIEDCDKKLEELKQKQKDLQQTKLDNIIDRYSASQGRFTSKVDALDARLEYSEAKGSSLSYEGNYTKLLKEKQSNILYTIDSLENERAKYGSEMKKAEKTFGKNSNEYRKAQAQYNDLTKEIYEQKTAYEENKNAIYDVKKTLADFAIQLSEIGLDRLDRATDIKEAQHKKIAKQDYQAKIDVANESFARNEKKKQLIKVQMAQIAHDSQEYMDLAEELNDLEQKQADLVIQMEESADKMREIDWEPFYNQIESLDHLTDNIEHVRGLLNSDNFVGKDALLTEDGAANLMLIAEGMEANKQKIADYKVGIAKINEEYANGRISEEKYKEKLEEYTQGVYNATNAVENYKDAILDLYQAQLEAENELLQENIDKRKESWKVQKDYISWARNVNKKNKDINAMKAQIAALEGVTNAVGQAKLAQLKAQLSEKQQDFDEDVEDRRFEKISDGLDKLSQDATNVLNSSIDALKRNANYQQEIVGGMLNTMVGMYQSAYSQINKIIESTGTLVNENLQNHISSIDKVSGTVQNATSSTIDASDAATGVNTKKDPTTNTQNQPVVDQMTGVDTKQEALDDQIKNVESISVSPTSKTLTVGQTVQIKVTINPSNALVTSVGWESSNTKVATVGPSGTVTAKAAGTAVIKCTSCDRNYKLKTATCSITVKAAANKPNTNSSKVEPNDRTFSGIAKDGSDKGNKKLDKNNSIVDRLKYLGYASDKKSRTVLWQNLGGRGSYSGSKEQNKWLLDALKNAGYKNGGVVDRYLRFDPNSVLGRTIYENGDDGIITASEGEIVLKKDNRDALLDTILPVANTISKNMDVVRDSVRNTSMIKNVSEPEVNIHYDSLITVNGAVDKYVVDDLNKIATGLLNNKQFMNGTLSYTTKQFSKEFGKLGHK